MCLELLLWHSHPALLIATANRLELALQLMTAQVFLFRVLTASIQRIGTLELDLAQHVPHEHVRLSVLRVVALMRTWHIVLLPLL